MFNRDTSLQKGGLKFREVPFTLLQSDPVARAGDKEAICATLCR